MNFSKMSTSNDFDVFTPTSRTSKIRTVGTFSANICERISNNTLGSFLAFQVAEYLIFYRIIVLAIGVCTNCLSLIVLCRRSMRRRPTFMLMRLIALSDLGMCALNAYGMVRENFFPARGAWECRGQPLHDVLHCPFQRVSISMSNNREVYLREISAQGSLVVFMENLKNYDIHIGSDFGVI